MEFRTIVDTPKAKFRIEPFETMLFVGSCFADNIGKRFQENLFPATVNPDGVMYNPASVWHCMERTRDRAAGNGGQTAGNRDQTANERPVLGHIMAESPSLITITLGTNHIYILKETGEIVDNCQKRPQNLFEEKELSVEECLDYLERCVALFPESQFIVTVSPIRYRKYGYHRSQLSKATLLMAADQLEQRHPDRVTYFPAYEILNDELRDYRFYAPDMLHPSEQAVDYIFERFQETFFSDRAKEFMKEFQPIKAALNHKPFKPESAEYQQFLQKTKDQLEKIKQKYK